MAFPVFLQPNSTKNSPNSTKKLSYSTKGWVFVERAMSSLKMAFLPNSTKNSKYSMKAGPSLNMAMFSFGV